MEQKIGDINNSFVKDVNCYDGVKPPKERKENKTVSVFLILAIVVNVAFFATNIIILRNSLPNRGNSDLDYIEVIAGIFSLLTTILIGWNIYSMIDVKSQVSEIKHLRDKLEREINYAHNKMDYYSAMSYGVNAQMLAGSLSKDNHANVEFQMLLYCCSSVKTLSNLMSFEECNRIVGTVLTALHNTQSVQLTHEEKTKITSMIYEINNMSNIKGIHELLGFLSAQK